MINVNRIMDTLIAAMALLAILVLINSAPNTEAITKNPQEASHERR